MNMYNRYTITLHKILFGSKFGKSWALPRP
jgi:hypothetical protein